MCHCCQSNKTIIIETEYAENRERRLYGRTSNIKNWDEVDESTAWREKDYLKGLEAIDWSEDRMKLNCCVVVTACVV